MNRQILFAGLCLVCLTVAGGYFWFARQHALHPTTEIVNTPSTQPVPNDRFKSQLSPRRIFYTHTAVGFHERRLAGVNLDDSGISQPKFYDQLACARLDFRGGNGICLRNENLMKPHEAVIFDRGFQIRHVIPLEGIASRTRVSPDGKWGAVTVFTSGDSYASGSMSTKTTLIDIQNGKTIHNLEEMVVRNKGMIFKEKDFNFWGMTFTNDSRFFYVTLATGGNIYLVKAELATLQGNVVGTNVECPALSPDNTRVAFKKRYLSNGNVSWQLAVLDLATQKVTLLPEPERFDQQPQWFDNRHVMYAMPERIAGKPVVIYTWIMAADGKTPPQKLLRDADCPVIVE